MQFYLDGYVPGDPDMLAPAPGAENRPTGPPEVTDVLIVGAGPAGLLLAAQLSTFPNIKTCLIEVEDLPPLLLPRKGRFGLIDYEKAYTPDFKNGPDIFVVRGIDRDEGALVVVRPDQYVGNVLPLDAHQALAIYFATFMLER